MEQISEKSRVLAQGSLLESDDGSNGFIFLFFNFVTWRSIYASSGQWFKTLRFMNNCTHQLVSP